ncbi:hypothetical protein RMATCC62417_10525 [Rhizopus microsporus]|nr:hypothetical protein RMATCC62417_10525 [Rhizopus microsporus]
MSNSKRHTDSSSSPIQNHSPDQPYYSLDLFYAELLSKQFKSSVEAIAYCRELCSNYGFTVKQEQSTHKNIYVYCSREGLPDSHRNPKSNPQRNRPSQRCECRWRIVLYENNQMIWEFRKSQNADAFIHNHPLMKPEEIKKEWPREVSEMIFALARQRLPTHEIRQQVREQYPNISWDDRRFYNRLSEERQKMKQRDAAMRTSRLVNLSAQLCMLNAGSEDLSHYIESKLTALLEETCRFANLNPDELHLPLPFPPDDQQKQDTHSCSISSDSNEDATVKKEKESNEPILKRSSISSKKSFESLPKGYLAVTIPQHTFHIKMYSQNSTGDIRRAIFENKPLNRRRSRFTSEEEELMDLDSPARKLSRNLAAIGDDEIDSALSSPSSPSGSQQNLVFPSTHQYHHHHQQKEYNSNNNDSNNLFFNSPMSTTHTTVSTSTTTTTASTNTAPAIHAINNSITANAPIMYHAIQDPIYDPSFMQSDLGSIVQQQQQQPHSRLMQRPHSMTFPMRPPAFVRIPSDAMIQPNTNHPAAATPPPTTTATTTAATTTVTATNTLPYYPNMPLDGNKRSFYPSNNRQMMMTFPQDTTMMMNQQDNNLSIDQLIQMERNRQQFIQQQQYRRSSGPH